MQELSYCVIGKKKRNVFLNVIGFATTIKEHENLQGIKVSCCSIERVLAKSQNQFSQFLGQKEENAKKKLRRQFIFF